MSAEPLAKAELPYTLTRGGHKPRSVRVPRSRCSLSSEGLCPSARLHNATAMSAEPLAKAELPYTLSRGPQAPLRSRASLAVLAIIRGALPLGTPPQCYGDVRRTLGEGGTPLHAHSRAPSTAPFACLARGARYHPRGFAPRHACTMLRRCRPKPWRRRNSPTRSLAGPKHRSVRVPRSRCSLSSEGLRPTARLHNATAMSAEALAKTELPCTLTRGGP